MHSRTSCGTQTPFRYPQDFFLKRHAPPSAPPGPHPWSGSSFPDTRCVAVGAAGLGGSYSRRLPLRSRRIPSATGRRPWAEGPAPRRAWRSVPGSANAASGWRLFRRVSSVFLSFSRVLSVILTEERSFHFQLRRNTGSQEVSATREQPCQIKLIWTTPYNFDSARPPWPALTK